MSSRLTFSSRERADAWLRTQGYWMEGGRWYAPRSPLYPQGSFARVWQSGPVFYVETWSSG